MILVQVKSSTNNITFSPANQLYYVVCRIHFPEQSPICEFWWYERTWNIETHDKQAKKWLPARWWRLMSAVQKVRATLSVSINSRLPVRLLITLFDIFLASYQLDLLSITVVFTWLYISVINAQFVIELILLGDKLHLRHCYAILFVHNRLAAGWEETFMYFFLYILIFCFKFCLQWLGESVWFCFRGYLGSNILLKVLEVLDDAKDQR